MLSGIRVYHSHLISSTVRITWGGSRGGSGVRSNPLNWNCWRQRILIRMAFWLKKTRPQNTMTWPQNVEIAFPRTWISEDAPGPPYRGPPKGGPTIEHPSGSAPDNYLIFSIMRHFKWRGTYKRSFLQVVTLSTYGNSVAGASVYCWRKRQYLAIMRLTTWLEIFHTK